MTSQLYSSSDVGNLVTIPGRNPIQADSLSFPEMHSASYQMPPAFQPDALTATLPPSNDIGAQTLASATNSNGWAAKQDWARYQALIKQLYRDERKSLAEVMRIMENQHGFRATVKMYKMQIKRWGLDKKSKEFEMRAIVRKNRQRADQGKGSIFRVRGQIRDFADVVRYWDRKGFCIDDLIARQTASPTPEAVEIFTPVSSPIMTPEVLAIPERMFRCIRDYVRGSFESETWVNTESLSTCYSIKDEDNAAGVSLDSFFQCILACSLFERNLFHEAGQTIIAATAKFKNVILAEHPENLIELFRMAVHMRKRERDEMALIILRQFAALSKVLLGIEHPLSRVCRWAEPMCASDFDAAVVKCTQVMADQFESFVGPVHETTLFARASLVDLAREGNTRIQMLQNLLGECGNALQPYDYRIRWLRTCLAFEYFYASYYVEAWTLTQRNIDFSQNLQEDTEVDLAIIARCQYSLGDIDLGIATFHKAIDLRMARCGMQDNLAKVWLVCLEFMYLEQGNWSSAAHVRDWREKLLELVYED